MAIMQMGKQISFSFWKQWQTKNPIFGRGKSSSSLNSLGFEWGEKMGVVGCLIKAERREMVGRVLRMWGKRGTSVKL